jgi:hypothetical protein
LRRHFKRRSLLRDAADAGIDAAAVLAHERLR